MQLKVVIDSEYSKQKSWFTVNNGYFAGNVFLNDRMLSEEDIRILVNDITTFDKATEFVKSLNGHFAIALEFDGTVFLAVDRLRTIPIFYEIDGDEVVIYNHVSFDMIHRYGINETALNELDNCLFVSGTKTLAIGISSVAAGEVITFTNENVNRQYYFEFDYEKQDYPDKKELFRIMDEKFAEAIKRLIEYLDGRCAVIPLSGGHDSRLVVYYLKALGYENIITYTYGPKGNFEAVTSEKVAKFLGLEWHFVEYEPKKLQEFFKENFGRVADYYTNGVSSVCVQDWYAVDNLHQNGILPKKSVFVPGHSFDCIAGSFILPKYAKNDTVTKKQLINDIIKKHYHEGTYKSVPGKLSYYEELVANSIPEDEPDILSSDRAFNLYQNYNVRERQPKYICCQPKLYEYYGYDWYLPLWDTKLIDFWETIDIKTKYNRKLFFEFTNYRYGDLMDAARVENEKSKEQKKVNMNPIYRVFRKINQLINYVGFHYCLAYFTRTDVLLIYARYRVLNIGFFVNQKLKRMLRRKNG